MTVVFDYVCTFFINVNLNFIWSLFENTAILQEYILKVNWNDSFARSLVEKDVIVTLIDIYRIMAWDAL